MISAPRTPPAPCPAGCTCAICGDDLTGWVGELRSINCANRWQAVDLKRPPPTVEHRPAVTRPTINVEAFAADMDALTRQARWGDRDQQGRQP